MSCLKGEKASFHFVSPCQVRPCAEYTKGKSTSNTSIIKKCDPNQVIPLVPRKKSKKQVFEGP